MSLLRRTCPEGDGSRAIPVSHAIKGSENLKVLVIAAVTMSSPLSADDEDVCQASMQLMCCPCLVTLTAMADLRALATAQGPEGLGRATAGCKRAYTSYSPEGSSSTFRTGTSIISLILSPNGNSNMPVQTQFGALG